MTERITNEQAKQDSTLHGTTIGSDAVVKIIRDYAADLLGARAELQKANMRIKELESLAALEAEEPEESIDALTLAKQWINYKEMPSLVTTLANDIQSYAESYHAKRCEDNWISVEERLPSVYENVLVRPFNREPYINMIELDGSWFYEDKTITHWQPLPAAPKKE